MARTGGINVAPSTKSTNVLDAQIANLKKQLLQKLEQYRKTHGVEHVLVVSEKVEEKHNRREADNYDFVNPQHYVQEDGKQTWERMVDKWGEKSVAIWCEMTAFKYQDRIGKKPGEDIEREQNKIEWYENKADELNELAKKKKFW